MPSKADIKGLQQEYQDSLSCPQCYALCSYTQYKLETTFTPIKRITKTGRLNLINNATESLALVKIYYAEESGLLYKTSVIMTWYDILSTFGGLLGLIIGSSMIMVTEIIYFCIVMMSKYLISDLSSSKENIILN